MRGCQLTAALLGLAMSPQRNPRKTCARSNPRSRPRRYLQTIIVRQRIRVAARLAKLTGGPVREQQLTNTRGDSNKAGVLVPNEIPHVCSMSRIGIERMLWGAVEMKDGERCSRGRWFRQPV